MNDPKDFVKQEGTGLLIPKTSIRPVVMSNDDKKLFHRALKMLKDNYGVDVSEFVCGKDSCKAQPMEVSYEEGTGSVLQCQHGILVIPERGNAPLDRQTLALLIQLRKDKIKKAALAAEAAKATEMAGDDPADSVNKE